MENYGLIFLRQNIAENFCKEIFELLLFYRKFYNLNQFCQTVVELRSPQFVLELPRNFTKINRFCSSLVSKLRKTSK